MLTKDFSDQAHREAGFSATTQPLRVVIAYNDVAAGKRAMSLLSDLHKGREDSIQFQPFPWSFDMLADANWRDVAASDAANADMLVIASSSANPLPSAVEKWAETVISDKRGAEAAVVAMFGPEQYPETAGSTRLQVIQRAAQHAGLDFFAPTPRHEHDEAVARVHQRAEAITPLLDAILHRRVESGWGINE